MLQGQSNPCARVGHATCSYVAPDGRSTRRSSKVWSANGSPAIAQTSEFCAAENSAQEAGIARFDCGNSLI